MVNHLAEGSELPQGDRGQLWLWSRPLRFGATAGGRGGAWRVPLPAEVACMTLGHMLELLLMGGALEVMGLPLQVCWGGCVRGGVDRGGWVDLLSVCCV